MRAWPIAWRTFRLQLRLIYSTPLLVDKPIYLFAAWPTSKYLYNEGTGNLTTHMYPILNASACETLPYGHGQLALSRLWKKWNSYWACRTRYLGGLSKMAGDWLEKPVFDKVFMINILAQVPPPGLPPCTWAPAPPAQPWTQGRQGGLWISSPSNWRSGKMIRRCNMETG